jgi:uncharacterized protein YigA (DUF484 family)
MGVQERINDLQAELQGLREAHLKLVENVTNNDGALRRIVELGLSVLSQRSLPELIRFLTVDFPEHHKTERSALRIIDSGGEIRHLLRTQQALSDDFSNVFVDSIDCLEYQIGQ